MLQRTALQARMAVVRQEMAATEAGVRANLESIRASGAALALPPHVVDTLRGAVMGGGGGGGTLRSGVGAYERSHSHGGGGYGGYGGGGRGGGSGSGGGPEFRLVAMRSGSGPGEGAGRRGAGRHQYGGYAGSYGTAAAAPPTAAGHGGAEAVAARPAGMPEVEEDPLDGGAAAAAAPWGTSYEERPRSAYDTVGPAPPAKAARREAELRSVLRAELAKEHARQATLRGVREPRERARLVRLFAAEREAARETVLALGSSAVGVGVDGAAPAS
eukprot:356163-Chlamydomonas_euryale.AAC.2